MLTWKITETGSFLPLAHFMSIHQTICDSNPDKLMQNHDIGV